MAGGIWVQTYSQQGPMYSVFLLLSVITLSQQPQAGKEACSSNVNGYIKTVDQPEGDLPILSQ